MLTNSDNQGRVVFNLGLTGFPSEMTQENPVMQGETMYTAIKAVYPQEFDGWVKTVNIVANGVGNVFLLNTNNELFLSEEITNSNKIEIQFEARRENQVLPDNRIFTLYPKRSLYSSKRVVVPQQILTTILEFMNNAAVDANSPYIGENGNWWVYQNGVAVDTGYYYLPEIPENSIIKMGADSETAVTKTILLKVVDEDGN